MTVQEVGAVDKCVKKHGLRFFRYGYPSICSVKEG